MARWWIAAGLALLAVPLPVAAGSCLLEPFNRGEEVTDGGTGGGDPICSHATYPPPPVDATAGGSLRFVVALRRVWLAELPDGGFAGLDLDLTCTCQGQGPTCVAAHDSCDEAEGRDSAMAELFGMLNTYLQLDGGMSSYFSAAAEDGWWTTLMRIEHYNGEADDAQVTLSWYTTTGLQDVDGGPSWDGDDQWPVSDKALDAGSGVGDPVDYPLYSDPYAYITDHVLVAALPRAEVNIAGSAARVVLLLTGGGLTARLVQTNQGWALRDGVVGARIPTDDLFSMLSSFRGVSQPVCMNSMAYPAFHSAICEAPDILIQPLSAGSPCEAVSFGLAFEADPALLGAVEPEEAPDGGCPPDADPVNDSCDAG